MAISRQTGSLAGRPEIVTRGVVLGDGDGAALLSEVEQVIGACVAEAGPEERTDQGLMTERLRVELRRFFKKRVGRRPLVLPVLMEI